MDQTTRMIIRNAAQTDFQSVIRLNDAEAVKTSPMDRLFQLNGGP